MNYGHSLFILIFLSFCSMLHSGKGSSFGASFGGGLVGGMMGSALTQPSRTSRTEIVQVTAPPVQQSRQDDDDYTDMEMVRKLRRENRFLKQEIKDLTEEIEELQQKIKTTTKKNERLKKETT